MKKPKEAPTTVVRQRGDDDPIGRGNYLNVTSKRMLLRILYLFKIGLLCINSRSNLAKKKFRNVHHKVAMVFFGCAESTIQRCVKENKSDAKHMPGLSGMASTVIQSVYPWLRTCMV